MGQIASRHRPDDPLPPHPTLTSTQSSATRIPDDSPLSRTQPLSDPLPHPSNHNSDLSHQATLPPKRSQRRSFLGTLRSPLRNCLNPQRIPSDEPNLERVSNTHKRWTFDRRRRRTANPPRTPLDHPDQGEYQHGGPSRPCITSGSSASSSDTTVADQTGKVKEDTPAASFPDLPSTVLVGPSSSSASSTLNLSPSSSVPLQSTATDISSPSSSAPPSTSSSSPPRDPPALNHDPTPLPTLSFEPPDDTPGSTSDNSEAFNVMERPATPPEPSQPPPLPEARRNFPAAGTLVVVQGVVHTSDVSQPGISEPSDATSRRASSVPPGERSSRRRFSDLLARPMRSRRSSYAAPESQPSEFSAMLENDSQNESGPTSESSQELSTQEDPPIPASRPLSLSPTSIDVLGTLLSVATAATAASLVSGSSEPLLNSGLGLPSPPSPPGSQQSSPPSVSDQVQTQTQSQNQPQGQSQSQGQTRPLSPTPTAGLASRDRMRNAWAGLRDRLGFRPSSPTPSPAPPSTTSPTIESEPAPGASPMNTVDPRTQLLADMARAFQMGMGLEDGPGSGSGSRSSAPSSPAIEVNLGDGQQRQQEAQPQERSPPPEDSFERFLMDLQVDLRRTLEDGQPEAESEPEQEQEVEPVGADSPPLIYPQEAPLSTHDRQFIDDDFDFIESLPALPPDDDDLLSYHHQPDDNVPDIGDDRPFDEEIASDLPPVPSQQPPSQPPSEPQTPTRHTIAGSERRPGGGINWWRMYRFPPMIVPQGTPNSGSSPTPPLPPPATAPPAPAESDAPSGEPESAPPPSTDAQANAQDVNTVVPVIVVGLQSVHGYGHNHGHRHTDGREEHAPQPPPPQQQQSQQQPPQWQQEVAQDNDLPQQDDVPAGETTGSPRNRERRWSSRAADALRGLRPVHGAGPTHREGSGSSSTEGTTRGGDDGHGSTTFFIYVIGGYYPPNHQLVIGTDPLDSFEELAELLGQAKPQTASREEIHNSGLEVIHMSSLAEYEKAGRVAPMCVDRCLICLEDYNLEEDLRLLSCRHVFHKDCVDRWLETGRNNCPACRTQGVSTSGPIPIPSSA